MFRVSIIVKKLLINVKTENWNPRKYQQKISKQISKQSRAKVFCKPGVIQKQHPKSDKSSKHLLESDMDITRNGRKIQHHTRGRGKSNPRRNKKSPNSKFSNACLPEQGEVLPEYDAAHCTIVGWGKEKNTHVYGTEVLHEAEVNLI